MRSCSRCGQGTANSSMCEDCVEVLDIRPRILRGPGGLFLPKPPLLPDPEPTPMTLTKSEAQNRHRRGEVDVAIWAMRHEGYTSKQIAKGLMIDRSTINRHLQKLRRAGSL